MKGRPKACACSIALEVARAFNEALEASEVQRLPDVPKSDRERQPHVALPSSVVRGFGYKLPNRGQLSRFQGILLYHSAQGSRTFEDL